jgi:two-component system LytT family response regulator
MPGKNGFELLSAIDGKSPEVIFTTAYDEYAITAFEYNALIICLKPIEFKPAFGSDQSHRRKQPPPETEAPRRDTNKILAKTTSICQDGEKCWFVKLGKVRLFESMGNYVRLHFDDQKPLVLKSLNSLGGSSGPPTPFSAPIASTLSTCPGLTKSSRGFSGGLLVTLKGGDQNRNQSPSGHPVQGVDEFVASSFNAARALLSMLFFVFVLFVTQCLLK